MFGSRPTARWNQRPKQLTVSSQASTLIDRQQRRFIENRLAFEAAVEESAGHAVFAIGASRHGFAQRSRPPRDARQPPAPLGQGFRVDLQARDFMRFGHRRRAIFISPAGMQAPPTPGDFFVAPGGRHIWAIPQKLVNMVAHHTETENIDGEDARQLFQTRLNPSFEMFETAASEGFLPAEKVAAHASRDAMVDADFSFSDDFATGIGRHASTSAGFHQYTGVPNRVKRLRGLLSLFLGTGLAKRRRSEYGCLKSESNAAG
jgi:hypothetical protein